MNLDGTGNMADVYYGAIRELTLLYPVAGADQVMGYTIAHELGHLLIGAGHRPNGLMRAALSKKELDALNQRGAVPLVRQAQGGQLRTSEGMAAGGLPEPPRSCVRRQLFLWVGDNYFSLTR